MKERMDRSGQSCRLIPCLLGLIFLSCFAGMQQASRTVQEQGMHSGGEAVQEQGILSGGEAAHGQGVPRGSRVALTEAKRVALTFDDGPHPIYTPQLLEGLKERGVTATFFVTGENATLYPELIEQMQEDGHIVGNHTYHHVQLSSVGKDVFIQELKETNRVLEGILEEEVVYVRPPYGDWTKNVEKEVNMLPVLWDVDPLDWCSSSTEGIVRKVLDGVEDNAIILLHDEYLSSIEAAFEIIDRLQEEGYEFVTVDSILLQ